MSETSSRIIVAVGVEDVEAMMSFAAEEAVGTGAALHLVHVLYLPGVMLPETYAAAYDSATTFGAALLEKATQVATDLVDGRVNVTSELVEHSGSAVHDIVARSHGARLVVLQHRHLEGLQRFATRSTALGVAARAHAPVVSVPEGWRSTGPRFGRVTVGVSNPQRADGVLRAGYEIARHRHSTLRVAHSWWLANGYDTVVVDDDMRSDFSQRFGKEIAPHLEPLQKEFPDVEVDVRVTHAPPAMGLLDATRDADVLVLGRRHWALPVGSHVGAVTRTMLHSATCPAVIVETTPTDTKATEPGGLGRQVQVIL